MSQQALIDKILAAAHAEAASVEAESLKRAKESAEIILKNGQRESVSTVAIANAAAAENIKTAKLMSELERRKMTLSAKRELMSEVYASALRRLCALDGEDWHRFMFALITKNAPSAKVTLCVPEADREKYTPEFLASLEKELSVLRGEASSVTLSPESATFCGGVMMISEYSDTDASFETVVADAAEQTEYEVSQLLFS